MNGVILNKIEIKELDIKSDERGWLAEILTSSDVSNMPFGLIHITTAKPGFTKGKHHHKRKTEWFCVIKGKAKLMLRDLETNESKEIYMGEGNMVTVKIPPNVFHSIENIGKDEMYVLAYVSEAFDPNDPDTYYE